MSNTAKIILVVLAFSIAGLIVGLIIAPPLVRRMQDGVYTRWEPLGAPPEPVARLVGYEFGDRSRIQVRVQADSGTLYHCCPKGRAEWRQVEHSDLVYADACGDLPPGAAPPPGAPAACVEVRVAEWVIDRTQFALIEDGSIWTWHHYVGFAPDLTLVCQSAVAGGLLGVVVAGIAWATGRRRSRA